MKTATKLFLAGVVLAASSVPLTASAVNIDVNISVPGFSSVTAQPVYYPAPVYYTPAPQAYAHHRDWEWRHRHDYRHYRHDYRHDDRRRW